MLSPGEWHKKVPKDPKQNLRFRKWLLKKCLESEEVRAAVLYACEQDLLFYINAFVWQYNPKSTGVNSTEVGPFITWPYQDDAFFKMLEGIETKKDVLIAKSKDMGASWGCLLVEGWMYLFFRNKKFLAISRNEDAVDKAGDSDSLFWKLDYVHEHLPDWMIGGRVVRRKRSFFNPITRSSITGQATTDKAGVGGRCTMMFIDEFAMIEDDFTIMQRTTDTTSCRIFNSTHCGTDTAFFKLSEENSIASSFLIKIRMHWSQHPDKIKGLYQYNAQTKQVEVFDKTYQYPPDFCFVMDGKLRSPWYDEQRKRKGSPRAIAMDLDIDPRGSVAQFADARVIRDIQTEFCMDPFWQGDVKFDREAGKLVEFVERKGGPLKLWLNLTADGSPQPGTYVFGADPSTGSGATPSCLCAANKDTGEKVLEYANAHIDPKDFAALAVALCWAFCTKNGEGAYIAWEIPGPGITFGSTVGELGYRNIYLRTRDDIVTRQVTQATGWANNRNTKPALLEEYRAALYSRNFLNRSWEALDQLLEFKYMPDGTVEHSAERARNDPASARVNHGDLVIADALCQLQMKGAKIERKRQEERIIPEGCLAYRRLLRDNRRKADAAWG